MTKLVCNKGKYNSLVIVLPKFKAECHTDGKGFWSKVKKKVRLNKAEVFFYEEDFIKFLLRDNDAHAHLKVYFPRTSWDYDKHGLIYTDRLFVRELRTAFKNYGLTFKPSELDYTEQGMQGDDYVSLYVYGKFLTSLADKVKSITVNLSV